MIDCMQEAFKANSKYNKFNQIAKVEGLKEDFDVVFPRISGEQPVLIKEKYINEELWEKYKGKECEFKMSFEQCVFPGFMDKQN
jgi:hypothetical protein